MPPGAFGACLGLVKLFVGPLFGGLTGILRERTEAKKADREHAQEMDRMRLDFEFRRELAAEQREEAGIRAAAEVQQADIQAAAAVDVERQKTARAEVREASQWAKDISATWRPITGYILQGFTYYAIAVAIFPPEAAALLLAELVGFVFTYYYGEKGLKSLRQGGGGAGLFRQKS